MKRIPRFRANIPLASQLTHQTMNAIVDAIEARTPTIGKGTRLRQTPKGFAYSADPGGRSRLRKLPFQVSTVSFEDDIYTIEVEPSTVTIDGTSRIPTINGTPMNERDEDDNLPRLTAAINDFLWLRIEAEWATTTTNFETWESDEPTVYTVFSSGSYTIIDVSLVCLPSGTPELTSQNRASAEGSTTSVGYYAIDQIPTASGVHQQLAYGPAMATPGVLATRVTPGGFDVNDQAEINVAFSSVFANE